MELYEKFQVRKIDIFWFLLIAIILVRSLATSLGVGNGIFIITSQIINVLVMLYGLYAIAINFREGALVNKWDLLAASIFCLYMLSLGLSEYLAMGMSIKLNIYMILLVVGVTIYNKLTMEDYTKYLNWMTTAYVYLSLIVYFLGYGMYGGGSSDARFMGLETHPSYCGFVISVYMVLNIRKNMLFQIVPIFLMSITMAKTSIGSLILCLGIHLLIVLKKSRWCQLYHFKIPMIIMIIYGFYLSLQESFDWTLTGRTTIWEYSIQKYINSKSYLWGIGTSYMSNWVGQAHNQFIQSLVSNGLIGLMVIVALLVLLLVKTLKIYSRTGIYEPLLVWILLFVRCFTEAPFKLLAIDTVSFPILYLILLPLFEAYSEEKNESFTYNE